MTDEVTSTTTETAAETSGDGTTTSATATEVTTTEATTTDGEAALGDAGKKALDAMKAKWKAAEQQAKETSDRLAALQAQIDGREAEHQASLEAQKVQDAALSAANKRIVSAELRAAAKGKVAEDFLSDLTHFIDPSAFEVGDDGSVDDAAIAQAITDLIASRPSLAAQGSRFQGSADTGARKDAPGAAQLTQSDLDRMTPEQIVAARKAGQFDQLMGINR
jgi:hypothetical protein